MQPTPFCVQLCGFAAAPAYLYRHPTEPTPYTHSYTHPPIRTLVEPVEAGDDGAASGESFRTSPGKQLVRRAAKSTAAPGRQILGRVLSQMLCVVRGGHRWETTTEAGGSVTVCARCGKVQHDRGGSGADASAHAVHDERP